jgi:hypothetical protein
MTLLEAHCFIYLKYHKFQSTIHNPGEYYEQAQNAADKLQFHGIILEDCSKVPKTSQFDFLQNLSEKINSHMFIIWTWHISSGSDNQSNREKQNILINSLGTVWYNKEAERKQPMFW